MKPTITLLFILTLSFVIYGAGELDTTFNASVSRTGNSLPSGSLFYGKALQPDGKLLLGNEFTVVNGFARSSIVRFNTDGAVDVTFNPPDLVDLFNGQASGFVYSIAVQSNGKILVGGAFGVIGTTYRNLIRLNSDGSLDTSFKNYAEQFQFPQYIKEIVVLPDDSFYIAGLFNLSNVNSPSSGVALLNSNGELNANSQFQINEPVYAIALGQSNTIYVATQFAPGSNVIIRYNSNGIQDGAFTHVTHNGQVYKLLLQPDGKLLVGGSFNNLNEFTVNYIGRVNQDGIVDTTFNTPISGGGILDIELTQDGKIIAVGAFVDYSNQNQAGVVKLNLDGTRDTILKSPFNTPGYIVGTKVQADGKILLIGGRASVIRINSNGTLDNSFATVLLGISGPIYDIVQQPDGKIIAGGGFNRAGNVPFVAIARYNTNGNLDSTFISPFSGYDATIYKIAIQSDGKILVGGNFKLSTFTTGMYRLNPNGSIDTSFNYAGGSLSVPVRDFEVLPDGKIIVNGTIRLLSNGARDNTYVSLSLVGGTVLTTRLQPDGKILIGGTFTQVGGGIRGRIARLNTDGTLDISFAPQGANSTINDIDLQPDGKILVVGGFSTLNGSTSKIFIGRLNSDGSLDANFSASVDKPLFTVKVQSNGRILIGGAMTIVNGMQRHRFARLNAEGSLDFTFTPSPGANGNVNKITLQSDDKILLGGQFTRVNNTLAFSVARLLNVPTLTRTLFDFDGDTKADIAVFRPSSGTWYIMPSQNNTFYGFPFGASTDRIVPADYDGDNKTDVAVFRETVPGAGNLAYFYIMNSSNGSFRAVQFGLTGDIPVSGDWDGDGTADLTVYRAAQTAGGQGNFLYRPSSQPTVNFVAITLGTQGDKPIVGDFDADGKTDAAVHRPSTATFIILRSSTNQTTQTIFGLPTDIPVPADYDGDGTTNIAVFRPSNGFWYTSQNPATNYGGIQFGANGDLPIPADYDGDGRADTAVFRPSNGAWFLNKTTNGLAGVQFGIDGDKPTPNAYIR